MWSLKNNKLENHHLGGGRSRLEASGGGSGIVRGLGSTQRWRSDGQRQDEGRGKKV